MKIAVISDIHGNVEALKTALENIEEKKVDTIICLGDLVGYGPYPNEVVEIIKSKKIMNILGNYDAAVLEEKFNYIRDNEVNKFCMPWAAKELSAENKSYLRSLPRQVILKYENKKIYFVHGSVRSINEYLKEGCTEAEEVMNTFDGDILVCAHTHIPYERFYNGKLLLNDGSVGKPKIGRPNGTYLIISVDKDTIETDIVEFTYDYEKTAKDMEEKKIHPSCIKNIRTGIE
ncbi:metallophosphoesterase family protein [Clostridiaceae bacterium UIB06]|uniref:Phosphoesterase n=1 Tax=Clostridium thailandense TaxID=2794346 RepID=A0A949TIJ7_9CLOT|nr:metallophosphoesterase family protein [Clostridium thailandense]MBV7272910.1 metallophosphoesterase family protein [Clostridium thailandense]MCH5136280.1 metallophosphoesterase family protein [Clostridiaceae bacterium UIB06]